MYHSQEFNNPPMPLYECVSFPAEEGVVRIIQTAQHRLLITTPYLNEYGVDLVLKHAHVAELWLLTNLDIQSMVSGVLDLSALLKLWDRLPLKMSSLGGLHAKAYTADEKAALITSANLPRGDEREL